MRRAAATCVLLAVLSAGLWTMRAAGSLDEALALYRAARYTEALEILETLDGAAADASDASREKASEYRALCLLALGRLPEARTVVRTLVQRRPDYRPGSEDLPPRFLVLVKTERAALLPEMARSEFRSGKSRYDQQSYAEAERHLRRAVSLANDPDLDPGAKTTLADLRELAGGFLDLSIKANATPVGSLPPAPPKPAPRVDSKAVFTASDREVTPPATIRQEIPRWRSASAARRPTGSKASAGLELVIASNGRVETARLIRSIDPVYDSLLLAAARQWLYEPARLDGAPVRFRKVLEIQVVEPTSSVRRTP